MFDLKALSAVESKLAERSSGRMQSAETLYEQALQLLEDYRASGDTSLLEQAMQNLSKTIQTARGLPEPYMLLAYLYHGLGAYRQSVSYLQEAQRLAPDSPFVAQLRQMMESGEEIPVINPATPEPNADALNEAEAEELYLHLQQAIQQALQAMDTQPPESDVELAAALESIEYKLLQWRSFVIFCQSQFELVRGSHETTQLELKLGRLRDHIKILEKHQRRLQSFEQVELKLDETLRLLPLLQQLMSQQQADSKPEFETLYDLCDELADQIDQHEAYAGSPIYADVISHYKNLIKQVEDLQDWLDENQI